MPDSTLAPAARPGIYPCLTYQDAPAMIAWLERAFGFTPRLVVADDTGGVRHAELSLGDSVLMLNSERPELQLAGPRTLGGRHAGICVTVDDPEAHHARAVAAGAEVLYPLGERAYGSREYSARDPEGVMWTFGTYVPGPWWDGKGGA